MLLTQLSRSNKFYRCNFNENPILSGTYRDETAPLFVGTILGIFALGAVTAYGIWRLVDDIKNSQKTRVTLFLNFRYLKVKKVQYGTMD